MNFLNIFRLHRVTFAMIVALVTCIGISFGMAVTFGYAPSDDLFLVVQNLAIRGPTFQNIKTVFSTYDPELYIPLTFVSYQIDYLVGGLNPSIFHLSNILIHSLNSILIFWIFFRITKHRTAAFFASLIFAIHPINTESVVWISARKDLLSTFFFLLTFSSYLAYSRAKDKRYYLLSMIIFVLALLSKVMVVTLPAILIIYDYLIDNRRGIKKIIIEKLPFIILSIIFIIIALGGKERVVSVLSIQEMAMLASKSTLFYVQKIFIPVGLTIIYPFNEAITIGTFFPYIIGILLMIGGGIFAIKKSPLIAFGLLWFALTLVPTFSNASKAGFIFFAVDRYAYVPSIGIFLIVAFVFSKLNCKSKILIGSLVSISLVLGLLSISQTRTWVDSEHLYNHAIDVYPESVPARASLARILRESGEYEEAFAVLKEGLPFEDHPVMHLGAGYIYARVGQVPEARNQFVLARKMDMESAEPVFSLGSLEEQIGNTSLAQKYYKEAIDLDPSYVIARVKLASILYDSGNLLDAKEQIELALEWNSNSIQAHELLAQILKEEGDNKGSDTHSEIAKKLSVGI
ncbi:tetratricopeptide repeat protein [Candidatus Peregrinibacteria bacterium]|jgi:protein O-mannosyl-transferase|nr:tetratricopeptide repeat protein [Candidatus Peregrinibacteria bacterium]MBT3598545.1 tetratricopeptide repeat protein [Candidatus Peregrinibacteria bacterium]MBT4367622.1 tetratricopeptide repeat protein [Candidatus Peregrinibacteria bacterium]MBT4586206.1 tetratricopeptide repeat protein [Candidatus Peregrinibacteria bacterium]MBT6730487.1 tetratricopeptide repeat protein [Candidatus Peregrinibacteria bacterium]